MSLPAELRPADAFDLHNLAGDVSDLFGEEAPPWHAPGTHPPVIVAFDVGAEGGAAILDQRGRLRVKRIRARFGRIDPEWRGQVVDVLEEAKAASPFDTFDPETKVRLRRFAGPIVAIEDVFVPRAPRPGQVGGFGSAGSAIKVARWGGALVDLATSFGLPAWFVHPTTWQSKILRGAHGRAGPTGTKATSRERAEALFGRPFENEHTADAACLAAYVRGVHLRSKGKQ